LEKSAGAGWQGYAMPGRFPVTHTLKIKIMLKISWMLCLVLVIGNLQAQTVSFNFSLAPASVSGWVNISGDPSTATRSGTSSGITVSSVSSGNWVPLAGVGSAYDALGASPGVFFPTAVLANHWFQATSLAAYNAAVPQLQISGLNKDSLYAIKMTGSSTSANNTNPTQYTVAGRTVNGYIQLNTHNNTTAGATFNNVSPDAGGVIRVYVNTAGSDVADICGIQIIRGQTNPPPMVSITSPDNNEVLGEDGNIYVSATASESGGSIVKVQFFVGDTTKIGEATSLPYRAAWVNPDEGHYKITATAIDANGVTNSTSINVSVESLTSFWSMTGNIAMNPDSNFIGNVDSVRLAFRTKNIERMSISPTGNVGIGTIAPTAQFHTTGTVRLAGLGNDSTKTRILVVDTSGNVSYRNSSSVGLTIGDGLGQTSGGSITIGDSIPGLGPHSFNSNRYQYLNGHMYSIGGSVNDPLTRPAFRVYDNGDLTAGTTMDRSVSTNAQTGFRYYAKQGIMQIGGSDRVDTTKDPIMYGHWPTSGLIINSDDSNMLNGKFMNTVFAGDANRMDSGATMEGCFIGSEASHFTSGMNWAARSIVGVWGAAISSTLDGCAILGHIHTIDKPMLGVVVTGYGNATADTAYNSLVGGGFNKFGGLSQLVSGSWLVNRTPFGTVLGNSNVDFATLNYTGLQGTSVAGISGYPLFALGNTAANDGSAHSNAVTVLYNGRTQINTTGHTNNLAQADVTPKAALEVVSTNSGVLLPKLTNAQRNAIVSGDLQNGLLLYNTDSSVFQYYNGSAWNSVGGAGGSGHWQFASGLQYDSVDNIAIGTSAVPAGYKLAVNGTAIFTKVRIKTAGTWPDYVFKKGYVLPGLAELERYVTTYKHLPGIASENEIQKEGLDLGDHAAAVLQKVEELTLYLIDENKKLKAQNSRISEQDRKAAEQDRKIAQQEKQLAEQHLRFGEQQRQIDELKTLLKKK
jgi:hypothetical protein